MTTHATIVPLIGGATIGQMNALGGQKPEYLASFEPFADNDQHIRNYLPDVPYFTADEKTELPQVDILNTVCPCAGLSMLSPVASADSHYNDWMYKTAEIALSSQPGVFWGENAPGLMGTKGVIARQRLTEIGEKYGYQLYLFKVNANEHGLAQNRPRTHYLFTKGAPPLNLITRDSVDVADLIRSFKGINEQFPAMAEEHTQRYFKKPSEDAFHRYVKEKIPGADTFRKKSAHLLMNKKYYDHWKGPLQEFMADLGPSYKIEGRTALEFVEHFAPKVLGGSLTFYRGTVFSCGGEIPAVINNQRWICHPDEDRFLTYRELCCLMGLPNDFEVIDVKKNVNHISQNVPANVAEDFVKSLLYK